MKHWFVLVLVLVLLAIRLASPAHDNPPETAPLAAAADVTAVFERACFDCHSNLTEWPWYSHLPPVSWVVGQHVVEGREHLNFSSWGDLSLGNQRHLAMEIVEEVEKGAMPLSGYVKLHGEAALGEADLMAIRNWARSLGAVTGPMGGHD